MNAPLVSVVIPAFNAIRTLGDCLKSIQSQTFKDFEAVIIDDGSTDETVAIARDFCAKDSRFKLIAQANEGCSVARNSGIARSQSEWIAFQDADDFWFPEKLARQIELTQTDPRANFIFTNLLFWDGERDLHPAYPPDKPLPEGDTIRRLIFADLYATNTVLVRRETLSQVGPFDPKLRLSQDWDLWLRIGEQGLRARGVREPMARYRRWPGNNTAKRSEVAEANVRMLEKNLALTRRDDLRKLYRRSIASARVVRELVHAYPLIEKNPGAMADATLRAWKIEPRLKWLRWYLLLKWPAILGGKATRRMIQRKFTEKCRRE
jgi:glycosyltransferase involved in cell wall biosynthesis